MTPPAAEASALAERIAGLLRERPRTFYEVVRAVEDAEYRTLLQAWGLLRERRALGRDPHGLYLLRG